MTVIVPIVVFWVMTPCSLVRGYRLILFTVYTIPDWPPFPLPLPWVWLIAFSAICLYNPNRFLTLHTSTWRRKHVPSKRRYPSITLHDVTPQKTTVRMCSSCYWNRQIWAFSSIRVCLILNTASCCLSKKISPFPVRIKCCASLLSLPGALDSQRNHCVVSSTHVSHERCVYSWNTALWHGSH
jgi:hypothetical protein